MLYCLFFGFLSAFMFFYGKKKGAEVSFFAFCAILFFTIVICAIFVK